MKNNNNNFFMKPLDISLLSRCVRGERVVSVSFMCTNMYENTNKMLIKKKLFSKFSAWWRLSSNKKTKTIFVCSVCFYCITTSLWRTPVNKMRKLEVYYQ